MYDRILPALALACALGAAPLAHAFDPSKTFADGGEPREVLRYGVEALRAGNVDDALGAFRFGAERNDLASQWKLARLMQDGAGGTPDHARAVELFQRIAKRHGEDAPPSADVPYVSGALVMLGLYAVHGVEGAPIGRDPMMAEHHFYRAAALHHDAEAQYQLGSLYRRGDLGESEPRMAARWLSLSARKGHPWAQADLGEMLIAGEGAPVRTVKGLVLLARAAQTLNGEDDDVAQRNRQAWATVAQGTRDKAEAVLAQTVSGPSPYASRRPVHSLGFPRVASR